MRSVCLYKFCVDVSATVSVYRYQLEMNGGFFELLKLGLMLFNDPQKQIENVPFMKIICPPGYHHNHFVATHALWHIICPSA